MKSGFKLVLITLPLVLLGAGFVAYTIINKPAPEQIKAVERATAVRVITARRSALAPTATGFGLITPARSYQAIAQVSGTAQYVNPMLKKGDILPEGAVLLRLSPSDYNLAIAQARANIRAAEARLAEIAVSKANQESALEIEQDVLALKSGDLERLEKLYAAGTASQTAWDGAKTAHLGQRQKVQNLHGSLALLPTQKLVQSEQIAVYQASLATAELNLARTELRLPFAARVASVSVEVGQFVGAGKAVASFDGVKTAEVEAQIPAADLQNLFQPIGVDRHSLAFDPSKITGVLSRLGLTAKVRLKLGQSMIEWPATLDRISNTIDQKSGTVGVILRIDNAYSSAELGSRPPLTKGMFVEVTLAAKPVDGIIIPRSALRDGQVMLVDAESRLKRLKVNAYLVQGDVALITGGLEAGARIVVSTPVPVIEGMLLDLHPDDTLMAKLAAAGSAQ
ncbi:efflux RND transporter periplasmic adaptor subunit [Profundibacter sp.]